LKILYTNFHAGPGIGGHSVYILSLAAALAARHDITIATPEHSGLSRRAAELTGVRVVAQSFPNRIHKLWAAVRGMRAVIVDRGIDVIHVNGSSDHRLAILASCRLGAKKPRIVFTKHNDIAISGLGAALRARVGTDHVIGVCNFVRDRLAKTAYARRSLSTIPNGVDLDRFKPDDKQNIAQLRRDWVGRTLPEGVVFFGSHAGTDDYKGWLDLVRGVADLPLQKRNLVHILLAGALPKEALLHELTELGMADQVSFVGRLDDVRPFIAVLDVGFVLSYRVETISFACREMMAMGCPVMVSDHGGLPENITDGVDGWVIPERNVSAISKRVSAILDQPRQLLAMGGAARAKSVSEFGLDRFVSQTERVYHNVTGQAIRRTI
jgi:glycosyltransferase involved in cell wall biosynthesis